MAHMDTAPMQQMQDSTLERRPKMDIDHKTRGRGRSRANKKKEGVEAASPVEGEQQMDIRLVATLGTHESDEGVAKD